jgi:hypothetical protein
MKGGGGWFVILSIIGVLIGIFMVITGWGGNALPAALTLLIGIFMVIKEILDITQGGGG